MKKYACQINFKGIGKKGQEKLKKSCVAIIGLGATGTISSNYLSRAGVGKLILVDKDRVDETNLHRQILYMHKDIGKLKVDVAKKELLDANPDVKLTVFKEFLSESNAEKILEGADLILDCTDKMSSRFVINNYCKKSGKIWVHSAASESKGVVYVVDEPDLFSRHFRSSDSFGDCNSGAIIGPVAGMAACMQSVEAIKILTGNKYCKEMQRFDLWNEKSEKIKLKK